MRVPLEFDWNGVIQLAASKFEGACVASARETGTPPQALEIETQNGV